MNHLIAWIKSVLAGLSRASSQCPGLYHQTTLTTCTSELAEPGYWPTELITEQQQLVFTHQGTDKPNTHPIAEK